jgi:ribonuclease BN (tRNA processing enzyme)
VLQGGGVPPNVDSRERSGERVANRIVVLGSCGAWPEPSRACSGFYIECQGARVVLDLGYGTLPRLLSLLDSPAGDGLDAVIVTHRHPDHMVDLHGLMRARWFARRSSPAIPLYAPAGVVTSLLELEEGHAAAIRRVFDWHALPQQRYRVGPFMLESWPLPHHVPNAGVRLTSSSSVIAYTGDCGPDPAVATLAAGADVFIAEATDRDLQPGTWPPGSAPKLHMGAAEAGRAAASARARLLMLTHFWPGYDRERSRALATAHFNGKVVLAEDGLEIPLP